MRTARDEREGEERRDELRELRDQILAMSAFAALAYEVGRRDEVIDRLPQSVHWAARSEWAPLAAACMRMISETADGMTTLIEHPDPDGVAGAAAEGTP
ncbi:hypothetical protein [Rhodoplanes azumiensis]|uniref:Uncharacterized protein n=1 Tax=Rhodoplanes azumiensis TaxID=1897628 RepID=A0ABW5AMY0_9BRAD